MYVPAHLYGELCRHADGARLVEREQITPRLTDTLRAMMAEDCPDGGMLKENARTRSIKPARLLKAKSCLWALVGALRCPGLFSILAENPSPSTRHKDVAVPSNLYVMNIVLVLLFF